MELTFYSSSRWTLVAPTTTLKIQSTTLIADLEITSKIDFVVDFYVKI